jgi:hypothetical protein
MLEDALLDHVVVGHDEAAHARAVLGDPKIGARLAVGNGLLPDGGAQRARSASDDGGVTAAAEGEAEDGIGETTSAQLAVRRDHAVFGGGHQGGGRGLRPAYRALSGPMWVRPSITPVQMPLPREQTAMPA